MVSLSLLSQSADPGSKDLGLNLNPASCYDVDACAFKCPFCVVTCLTCIALSDHLEEKHCINFPKKCEGCGVGTYNRIWLASHEARCAHRGQVEQPADRVENGVDGVSSNSSQLEANGTADATAAEESGNVRCSHVCEVCERTFGSEHAVRIHAVKAHPAASRRKSRGKRGSLKPIWRLVSGEDEEENGHSEEQKPPLTDNENKLTARGSQVSSSVPESVPCCMKRRNSRNTLRGTPADRVEQASTAVKKRRTKVPESTSEGEAPENQGVDNAVSNQNCDEESVPPAAHEVAVERVKKEVKAVTGITKCQICGASVFSPLFLERHMKTAHSSPEKSVRRQKGKSGSPNKRMSDVQPSVETPSSEVRKSKRDKPVHDMKECSDEDEAGREDGDEATHGPEPDPPRASSSKPSRFGELVKCPVCSLTMTIGALPKHSVNHRRANGFECHVCNLKFPLRLSLERHVNYFHPPMSAERVAELSEKFQLKKCKVVLRKQTDADLQREARTSSDPPDERELTKKPKLEFLCSLCPPGGKSYMSERALNVHKGMKHKKMQEIHEPEDVEHKLVKEEAKEEVMNEGITSVVPEQRQKDKQKGVKICAYCPFCNVALFSYMDSHEHINKCREKELERARTDDRVVVLRDLPPHAFHRGEKRIGYRCVDCRRRFIFYNQFCLHARCKKIKDSPMSSWQQFLARQG